MNTGDFFKTLKDPSRGIYKDKGSSFLSFIYPVLQESMVKPILLNLKKEHTKARHICHGYLWGPDPDYYRINDDGEPGGTAGSPILNQLKSHKLENTLLVVVRYFGGTLLGVPGLIHAYKQAALDAIQHASIITRRRNVYFKINATYSMEKNILFFIRKNDGEVVTKKYDETIEIEISFPLSQHQKVLSELPLLSNELVYTRVESGLHGKSEHMNWTYLRKDDF